MVEQEQGHSAVPSIEKTKAVTIVSSAYKTANPMCSHSPRKEEGLLILVDVVPGMGPEPCAQ